jgi:hypothetical protein
MNKYLYLVVSKDTSLQTDLNNIICIKETISEAREHMESCRRLMQFNMKTQTFAEVIN